MAHSDSDIKPRPSWEEAQEAINSGRFGPRTLLNRLAVGNIERDHKRMGVEGCGISSSDVNHEVYGAVAWAMQHNLDTLFVLSYLGGAQ